MTGMIVFISCLILFVSDTKEKQPGNSMRRLLPARPYDNLLALQINRPILPKSDQGRTGLFISEALDSMSRRLFLHPTH